MTKQVALSDQAYQRLRKARLPGESFSDAVERLIGERRKDPMRFIQRIQALKWTVSPEEQIREIEAEREASRQPA